MLLRILIFITLSPFVSAYSQSNDTMRTIVVTILHGSRPKRHTKEIRLLGGMRGGHVMVKMDSFAYGFNFTNYRIHAVPHRNTPTGTYEKYRSGLIDSMWTISKVTRIEIPVSKRKFDELKETYESYYLTSPHDYAFFGMRCAASAYWMLGKAGIFNECTRRRSIIRAFHPKAFRKKIERTARRQGYKIILQKGRPQRKWEGD
jgi:hypothetical protein